MVIRGYWLYHPNRVLGVKKRFQSQKFNFYKRWENMMGESGGYEFRPLKNWDYGYPRDDMTTYAWITWVIQTIGNYQVGFREALITLLGGVAVQEMIFPYINDTMPSGAGLVSNIQCGVNIYHSFNENASLLTKGAACEGLIVNFAALYIEEDQGFEINEIISHDVHAIGVGLGIFAASFMKKYLKH